MISAIKTITGTAVPVLGDDIDTDRIIPGRFLKCVTFDGLGEFAFYDERYSSAGKKLNHPIDQPQYAGGNIMLSGKNFGCGSSREHAPQAIKRAGFAAVIAESYAEIFFGNSTTLGIACIEMKRDEIAKLAEIVQAKPDTPFTLDLEKKTVTAGNLTLTFSMKEGARTALVNGTYDSLAELLANMDKIKKLDAGLSYRF